MGAISDRLQELRDRGLYRRTRLISGPQGPHVVVDGRPALLLCSNNYLGLADHPRVREAAAEAAMRWGVGAGSSRLVSGTMTVHRRLEERLAAFEGTESAILFGSGYLANTGVIAAVAQAGGVVFSDELNHASLIDGCRLAGAETVVYDHCDLDHLEWNVAKTSGRPSVIVTDSVFSMDGDIAPLEGIVDIARRYGSRTVVDEAHGTGVVGPEGRGAVEAAGLSGEIDVVVGTLGKSLGSYGAYAACSSEMADWLTNRARTLIFSTAPPPPSIAGAMEALTILEEEPRRVDKLRSNGRAFRKALRTNGFDVAEQETPIIPLIVGSAAAATDLCQEALARGVYAQAIRPPTVPEGTSRLRLSVMASHKPAELEKAAAVIAEACLRTGLKPAGSPERQPAGAPGDDGREIRASRRGRSSEVFDFEAEALDDFRRAA
jgi:glycine C-acetyltransferase/8-amino-7-oxononanoate synthase